jgi:hypothetical protein
VLSGWSTDLLDAWQEGHLDEPEVIFYGLMVLGALVSVQVKGAAGECRCVRGAHVCVYGWHVVFVRLSTAVRASTDAGPPPSKHLAPSHDAPPTLLSTTGPSSRGCVR